MLRDDVRAAALAVLEEFGELTGPELRRQVGRRGFALTPSQSDGMAAWLAEDGFVRVRKVDGDLLVYGLSDAGRLALAGVRAGAVAA